MQNAIQENQQERISEIAAEISLLKTKIDAMKPMYSRMDELTSELVSLAGINLEVYVPESYVVVDDKFMPIPERIVKVVDNFENKSVVFRPAGVRRFEPVVENISDKALKK